MDNKSEAFSILDSFKTIIDSTWNSSHIEDFNKCFLFIKDFKAWVDCLQEIPQSLLFKSALNECATANLFCCQGLYKHAIVSLRFCLEHCLFAIHMSSNDFLFRRWKEGREDLYWSAITNSDTGIFSKNFIHSYAPEFEDMSMELNAIAVNVYRECSEYVHGNYSKLNCLPEQSEFNEKMLSQYISHFNSISYLISVMMFIRFKDYILSKSMLTTLEDSIMHNIGMLPQILSLYSKNGDEINE